MPVIINQLDVEVDRPPAPSSVASGPPPPPTPSAIDVAELVRHLEERRARTRAD